MVEQPQTTSRNFLKNFSTKRVLLAIAIGLGATVWLFVENYNVPQLLRDLRKADLRWILAAFGILAFRDFSFIYRIRNISLKELSWKQSTYSIMLWEFASALSPSAVGGTAIAAYILFKEGISFGRSVAYVMLTAILDNLFFIFGSLLAFAVFYPEILPDLAVDYNISTNFLLTLYFVSSGLILLYTIFMMYGLFVKPRAVKWVLFLFTRITLFKKWRAAAINQGNEMMIASEVMRGKTTSYWVKAIISTFGVWAGRYWVLNCLAQAFVGVSFQEHLLIFHREIIHWVTMLISITPGASGLAEVSFEGFFKEFLGQATALVALFWRLFTYYPYLVIGAILLPRWVKRVFTDNPAAADNTSSPQSATT